MGTTRVGLESRARVKIPAFVAFLIRLQRKDFHMMRQPSIVRTVALTALLLSPAALRASLKRQRDRLDRVAIICIQRNAAG